MNKTELSAKIEAAQLALSHALTTRADAVMSLNSARAALADAENKAILSGLEGKNESERRAKLAEVTSGELEAVREAETMKVRADGIYDAAKLEWDAARQLVAIFTSAAE